MANVTKQDLIGEISKTTGLTQSDVKVAVEEFLTVISETLTEKKAIEIRGFGTFLTKVRKPRPARNPKTGEVLAMVGSRDYWDTERDGQVNLTTALRQPGSAIKPVNYSVALESGFTAATVIQDSPVTYDIPGSKPYSPVNYDGKWHGPVTVRQALANSYNVPAVKILASYGVDKMIAQGQKLGITTWNQPERYGLSLTLGGAEVKMTDMAVIYGTLANLGEKVSLKPILTVSDAQDKLLKNFSRFPEVVLDPKIAYLLTDILSNPVDRAQAFGTRSYLNVPGHQVAVKTGTSNDKRDNWTVGYTQDIAVGVWVGNNDSTPMSRVASGVTGASPIWNKIMVNLLGNSPSKNWDIPEGMIKKDCYGKIEYFLKENIPSCAPIPTPAPLPLGGPQILDSGARVEVNVP